MAHTEQPVDPVRPTVELMGAEAISPKAAQIFEAARVVVDRDGADKLTLRAVAKEAGVPSSLAMYYFSSMEKLEALLLDSLWRDQVVRLLSDIESPPASASGRIGLIVQFHSRIAENLDGCRIYFELVTHVVRNPATRRIVADIYEGYREKLNLPLLLDPRYPVARARPYAAVTLAAGEGLPLARLLGGTKRETDRGFGLLAELLEAQAAGRAGAARGPSAPPRARQARRDARDPIDASSSAAAGSSAAERLIQAGISLLHTGGLREITFGNVATAAGEAKGLIGYYFANKRGYIDALVQEVFREWSARIARAAWNPEGLSADVLAEELFGERSPLVSAILLQPVLRHSPERLDAARAAYSHARETLADCFGGPHPAPAEDGARTAAVLFLAVLNGLALQWLYDPEGFELRRALRALTEMLPGRAAPAGG